MTPVPGGAAIAPAKINLSLNLTGKTADGYHLLDSIVAFADFGDRLTLTTGDADDSGDSDSVGPQVRLRGPFADSLHHRGGDTLVLAAMRLMARRLEIPAHLTAPLTVTLAKNLPIGAGFGGGSGDAAACLRLLAARWGAEAMLDGAEGAAMALELGADVPVCLRRGPTRVRGIGEVLDPLPPLPPGIGLLLLFPGFSLATGQVFAALAMPETHNGPAMSPSLSPSPSPLPLPLADFGRDARDLADILARRGNDLYPAALSLCPALAPALDALRALPDCRYAAMSGSGSGCFALFDDPATARAARDRLRTGTGWWTAAGRFTDTDGLPGP